MKKVLVLVLSLIMICTVFTGCGDSNQEGTEAVELTLWTPPVFDVGYMEPLKALAEEYEASHEGVSIEIVELNWDGIGEKLESAMMTGSTPDIYIDGTARTAKLPATGLVADVTDVISDLGKWEESCVAIGEIDGKDYLVPLTQMPPTCLTVNATLAKKYGCYDLLPEDRVSWDWDQFIAFLKAVNEKSAADGVAPIGLYAGSQSSDISYYTMLLSGGANILNEDHSKSAVNCDEAVAVLGKLKEILDLGLAYPGAESIIDEEVDPLFYGSKIVINPCANSLSATLTAQSMKEQGLLEEVPEFESYAFPTLNGSKTMIGNWGANCIAVFKNDENEAKIAAAKDFIKFIMDDKEFSETLWAAAPSYGPVRDLGQELKLDDEHMLKEAEASKAMGSYCTSGFGLLESYWGEIRQGFYPELQSMFLGNKEPKEVVENFDKWVTEVLANNQ